MRLNNSITPVDVDMIATSIDEIIHKEKVHQWDVAISDFNRSVHDFEVKMPVDTNLLLVEPETNSILRNIINSILRKAPKEFRYDISDSSLYFLLRETLLNAEPQLMEDKPVRRFFFNGPLVHFNHYRSD